LLWRLAAWIAAHCTSGTSHTDFERKHYAIKRRELQPCLTYALNRHDHVHDEEQHPIGQIQQTNETGLN
jgi:hypothetical protein